MNKQTKQTVLEKVRAFFSAHDIDPKELSKPEKFEAVLLEDGVTEVMIEPAVEAGAAITMTAEDGTPVPAPAGEYKLQDGRICVVVDEGVVAEVREAAPVTEVEEPMSTEGTAAAPSNPKQIIERTEIERVFSTISALEARVGGLEKVNKFLKEENEHLKKELVETKQFTKETLETLLSEPSKEPVIKQKSFAGLPVDETSLDAWLAKHSKQD